MPCWILVWYSAFFSFTSNGCANSLSSFFASTTPSLPTSSFSLVLTWPIFSLKTFVSISSLLSPLAAVILYSLDVSLFLLIFTTREPFWIRSSLINDKSTSAVLPEVSSPATLRIIIFRAGSMSFTLLQSSWLTESDFLLLASISMSS